jgi:hypothetical protein
MALIASRRNAGDEAGVGELRAAIQDSVRRYHEAGITGTHMFWSVDYEEGLSAFLAGDTVKGLASIAKAVNDGYFIKPNAAFLIPIRAGQEARQSRERNRLLNIVCKDNPYQSFWQPEPGTCEQYLAETAN